MKYNFPLYCSALQPLVLIFCGIQVAFVENGRQQQLDGNTSNSNKDMRKIIKN